MCDHLRDTSRMLDELEYLDNLKRNGLGKSPSVSAFMTSITGIGFLQSGMATKTTRMRMMRTSTGRKE